MALDLQPQWNDLDPSPTGWDLHRLYLTKMWEVLCIGCLSLVLKAPDFNTDCARNLKKTLFVHPAVNGNPTLLSAGEAEGCEGVEQCPT